MNILDKIIKNKMDEIKECSLVTPLEKIKNSQRLYSVRNFKSALLEEGIQIIAEIKRKSPSCDNIFANADPVKIAKSYEKNGAAAISVLTDLKYFGGELDFIQDVRAVVEIPVLRKDFIISEYQIWESFYVGADAILLIADALDGKKLFDLYHLAIELGMHVLVEVHSSDKLRLIRELDPEIVGVNCRNLHTMKTDIDLFKEIYEQLPDNCIKVAESGISTQSDLQYILDQGYSGALVGTILMKSGKPGSALARLLNRVIK